MMNRRKFLITAATMSALPMFPFGSRGAGRIAESVACTGSTISLRDGRRLGYAIYGDPQGRPILYFHGIPTSRMEARFFEPAALRAGCRLIAIDRPGYGLSDFQCGRCIVDWVSDIQEFVSSDQLPVDLNLDQFSIACFSSGAAYALLCAKSLPPTQVKSVGIVDGIAPLDKICGCGGYSQVAFQLAANHPRVARTAFDVSTRQMQRRPDRVLRRTSHFFSPCDESVFFDPCHSQILIDSYLECVRCGPDGVLHDMSLLAQPWGFCVEDVDRPVSLWYGACDETTPVASMGNYLNRAIRNSTLTIYPNQGHLTMLVEAGEALFQQLQ